MSLFIGTFVNKIDKKGRVSVPATFRAALSGLSFQGIIAFRSYKVQALEACGIDRMELLSKSLDTLDVFSQDQDDLTAALFADSHQIPFDGEGRIMLPQEMLDFAKISEQAAFVGRGKTFQIWTPEDFKHYQNETRERLQQNKPLFKINHGNSPTGGNGNGSN